MGWGKGHTERGERPKEPEGKRGRGGVAGGRNRDGEGATSNATGAENRITAETMTAVARARGQRSRRETTHVSSNRSGGGDRKEGSGREESATFCTK